MLPYLQAAHEEFHERDRWPSDDLLDVAWAANAHLILVIVESGRGNREVCAVNVQPRGSSMPRVCLQILIKNRSGTYTRVALCCAAQAANVRIVRL